MCQELMTGAKDGAARPREHRRKGSEKERLHFEEANSINGSQWRPSPRAVSMDLMSRVRMPLRQPMLPPEVDARPIQVRGIAVKKGECRGMGPTPGCRGCEAIARGRAAREPRGPDSGRRVIEWLGRPLHSREARCSSDKEGRSIPRPNDERKPDDDDHHDGNVK